MRTKKRKIYEHSYYLKHKETLWKLYKNAMIELKINGCSICGYNKCHRGLSFHHTNPNDKKFEINLTNLRRKDKYIIEELNKCILLCSNCHNEITEMEE